MKPTVRLAMLEADTPLPNTKAQYGGYGGVFTAMLRSGAIDLGRPDLLPSSRSSSRSASSADASSHEDEGGLQIKSYQIEIDPENYPKMEDIDAILITGSRTSSFISFI